jgi:hypothetical protein
MARAKGAVHPGTDFFNDLKNGAPEAVSFVKPAGARERPPKLFKAASVRGLREAGILEISQREILLISKIGFLVGPRPS